MAIKLVWLKEIGILEMIALESQKDPLKVNSTNREEPELVVIPIATRPAW